jgi:hypothetical protein
MPAAKPGYFTKPSPASIARPGRALCSCGLRNRLFDTARLNYRKCLSRDLWLPTLATRTKTSQGWGTQLYGQFQLYEKLEDTG